MGRTLYRARPIRVEPQCLACHSTAQAAPATLLARYGSANGFGWQPNEIIGAQVVSVPMNAATVNSHRTRSRIEIAIAASFALMLVSVNALLYFIVIRPLRQMTWVADRLSRGEAPRGAFSMRGPPEIVSLARAFERLRISLEKAMKRLQS
jgi:methyl-accepting chemotaxis protein